MKKIDLVNCQVCQKEMSFGRIKYHVKNNPSQVYRRSQKYIINEWEQLSKH